MHVLSDFEISDRKKLFDGEEDEAIACWLNNLLFPDNDNNTYYNYLQRIESIGIFNSTDNFSETSYKDSKSILPMKTHPVAFI